MTPPLKPGDLFENAEMHKTNHFGRNQANVKLQRTVGIRKPDECENITQKRDKALCSE